MKKISQEEWEKRYEEIEKASEICRTMKEVEEKTGYGKDTIRRTLRNFPDKRAIVFKNLKMCKKQDKTVIESSYEKAITIVEKSKKCKNLKELEENTGFSYYIIKKILSNYLMFEEEVKSNLIKNKAQHTQKVIMIDTSICQIENFFNILEEYIQKGYIIGITDILLDELDMLQKNQHKGACKMLHIILNNITFFKLFEEKSLEEQNSPDERIMKSSQREGTELLTSDKMFCIKAILKGINARYIGQNEKDMPNLIFNVKKENIEKIRKNKLAYIPNVHLKNNFLVYSKGLGKKQYNKIFTKDFQEKQGNEIALEVGDHVFRATDKEDFITVMHYEICDNTSNYCSYIRFRYNSYKCDTIINVQDERYKNFIKEARKFFNC